MAMFGTSPLGRLTTDDARAAEGGEVRGSAVGMGRDGDVAIFPIAVRLVTGVVVPSTACVVVPIGFAVLVFPERLLSAGAFRVNWLTAGDFKFMPGCWFCVARTTFEVLFANPVV